MKTYYEMQGIGKAKYTVSKYDGIQTHNDGSPFFDIAIFKNKIKKSQYINNLLSLGYKERTNKY